MIYSGGEEVMLDVGGQDATEAFEDVGHSDEARETLDKLLIGTLKRQVCPSLSRPPPPMPAATQEGSLILIHGQQPGDPVPSSYAASSNSNNKADQSGMGVGLYAIVLIGGGIAYAAYQYMQANQKSA